MDDILIQQKLIDTLSVDPECSYRNYPAFSSYAQEIQSQFSTLINKTEATFQVNLTGMFPEECYRKMVGLNYMRKASREFDWSAEVYLLAQCYEPSFFNPMTLQNDLDRTGLLIVVLLTDVLIVFSFMVSIVFLKKIAIRSLAEFKEHNKKFETRDFAIQVSNLPKIKDYKNPEILKALLFDHFETIAMNQP